MTFNDKGNPHENTKAIDPNPNNRTEQEYRALIRGWRIRIEERFYANDPVIKRIADEMEKEVP